MPNFCRLGINEEVRQKKLSTEMGFEPTRAEPIGLAVQRLNHSATQSSVKKVYLQNETIKYVRSMYLISPFGIL